MTAPHPIDVTPNLEHPVVVYSMTNPVTKTTVRLLPPAALASEAVFAKFSERFAAWCAASWDFGRQDPAEAYWCAGKPADDMVAQPADWMLG